jgi:formyl-CoA transferase
MPHQPASAALADITVLDLTRVRSGPTAVRQLADWGANVIKVELPQSVQPGQGPGAPRHSSDFQNLQRNKRAITLNLKSEEGLTVFKRLIERADVVVENFRPDVKQRLGIDYETLNQVNPRLVYASISGFGQDGPYRNRPGFDQVAQGMGGLMSITGLPGQGPVRAGIPIADLCAGLFCAYGVMVALYERERSGKGQWVTTSLLEAMSFMLDFQATRWLVDGIIPPQAGNDHPTSIPTGVFETSDGYMNIATSGGVIWERFCKVMEAEEWITHPDYVTEELRSKNRVALNAEINERTRKRDTRTWVDMLTKAGVPSGEINTIDQVFDDPQIKHLGIAQKVNSKSLGELTLVGQPVSLHRTPSKLTVAPPEMGEHNVEVLKECGYSEAEIASMSERDVI